MGAFSQNVQTTAGFCKAILNNLFLVFQAVQALLLPELDPDTLLLL